LVSEFISVGVLKTRISYKVTQEIDDLNLLVVIYSIFGIVIRGSSHKRQKPQAPTPQAPIRNRQTRKVAMAKGLNRNTNLA